VPHFHHTHTHTHTHTETKKRRVPQGRSAVVRNTNKQQVLSWCSCSSSWCNLLQENWARKRVNIQNSLGSFQLVLLYNRSHNIVIHTECKLHLVLSLSSSWIPHGCFALCYMYLTELVMMSWCKDLLCKSVAACNLHSYRLRGKTLWWDVPRAPLYKWLSSNTLGEGGARRGRRMHGGGGGAWGMMSSHSWQQHLRSVAPRLSPVTGNPSGLHHQLDCITSPVPCSHVRKRSVTWKQKFPPHETSSSMCVRFIRTCLAAEARVQEERGGEHGHRAPGEGGGLGRLVGSSCP